MGVPKPTEKQRALNVLEAKMFNHYQAGDTAEYTATELNVRLKTVQSRFWDWDLQKNSTKKEIEMINNPLSVDFTRQKNADFILMTNNDDVLEAYCRMINPIKTKLKKAS